MPPFTPLLLGLVDIALALPVVSASLVPEVRHKVEPTVQTQGTRMSIREDLEEQLVEAEAIYDAAAMACIPEAKAEGLTLEEMLVELDKLAGLAGQAPLTDGERKMFKFLWELDG